MARSRELKVTIVGDADSLRRALGGAGKHLDRFGKTSTNFARGVAASLAGATVGVALVAKKSVAAASDINESLTKNQALFGKNAAAIDKWSRTTATSIGISRGAALDAAGTFGGLFDALDIGQKQGAGMSKRLVDLAADLASFNNASPEEALDALRSGLSGESEPMRKFNAFLSEGRVKTEAYKEGIAKTGAELTEQQKVQARYSLILKDTAAAQGDFAKTSQGYANLQRTLKAELEDVTASIGQSLLPAAKRATKELAGLGGEVSKIFGRRDLDLGDKFTLSAGVIRKRLQPLAKEAGQAIEDAHLGDKLDDAIEKGVPKIMNAMARGAGGAAKVFVNAWLHADIWGKLITAGFLAGKLGAFRGAGSAAADYFVQRWRARAAGSMTAAAATTGAKAGAAMAGAEGLTSAATLGKFKGAGKKLGKATGVGMALGLILAAPEILKQLRDMIEGVAGRTPSSERAAIKIAQERMKRDQALIDRKVDIPPAKKQAGGLIPGLGVGDIVPALLEPGEFVIRRKVVEKFGPTFFAGLNRVGVAKMSGGGPVTARAARGASYSKADLVALARRVGFPDPNLAAAVALAESGGNPNATNRNSNGSIDRGLWQINSVHGRLSVFDPLANARAAYSVSGHGRNWHPWVAYNNGSYRKFLAGTASGGTALKGGGKLLVSSKPTSNTRGDRSADGVDGGERADAERATRRRDGLIVKGLPGSLQDGGTIAPQEDAAAAGETDTATLLQHQNELLEQQNQMIKQLHDEAVADRQRSEHIMSITGREATRALADVISGEIGGRLYQGRSMTPGAGAVARA